MEGDKPNNAYNLFMKKKLKILGERERMMEGMSEERGDILGLDRV